MPPRTMLVKHLLDRTSDGVIIEQYFWGDKAKNGQI